VISGLAGLSALYPGYVQGRKGIADADASEARAEELQIALQGRAAFGNALRNLLGGPQPPMPGQASLPDQPPAAQMTPAAVPPGTTQAPQGPPGGSAFGGLPGWAPGERPMDTPLPPPPSFASRFQGEQPMPPQGAPQQTPQGGTPQAAPQVPQGMRSGSLDWRPIIQSVVRANPGAPPQVIAAAVDNAMPLMNLGAKMEWQELRNQFQTQLAQNKLDTAKEIAAMRDRGATARNDARIGAQAAPTEHGLTPEALDGDAQRYLKTGQLPPNMGRGTQGRAQMTAIRNRAYELAAEQGLQPQDLPKNWQKFKGAQIAIQRFESGPQGNVARSMNVAIDHLSTIDELAKALNNKDIPAFNRIVQTIAEQTGKSAPTNLDAAKAILGPEIIKAIGVAGAGTKEERQHAADAWNKARSPEQLAGATATIKKLLAGQLRGLRQQYVKSTGLPAKDFDEMMLPETLRQLEGLEQAGPVQVKTPQEAQALKPGTKYTTPDGQEYTR